MSKKKKRPTQAERVIKYMLEHGTITVREAMNELDINSLRARLTDLDKMGYEYTSTVVHYVNQWGEKNWYKRYYLLSSPDKEEQKRIDIQLLLRNMSEKEE